MVPTGCRACGASCAARASRNRQANAALYRVIIVRMRWHLPTIAYIEKRTADGLTKKEIIRCLKRYLAREIYRLLPEPAAPAAILAPAT